MNAIGMLNKALKLPPKWTDPVERNKREIFTCFETRIGGQWAFLGQEDCFRIASSEGDWAEHVVTIQDGYRRFDEKSALELFALVGAYPLTLDEMTKLWLVASIKAAADLFLTMDRARGQSQ